MSDEREQRYLSMISQFPDSPLGYFSLGRYLIEQARFEEAVERLRRCTELDPTYAAALVSLGDALAGAGKSTDARQVFAKAREAALAQNHPSLAEEIDERVEELG